ncbi:MAG TPA: [cytidine(C)-cytidine(C)-adenosine (A)]-adding enzyme [Cyanothece sp. UBA12306]|nr:[cytidine(C)-cytidine(C)-adenosine (A)]-adding enzyme [Cyanothece sp. UBA12306]
MTGQSILTDLSANSLPFSLDFLPPNACLVGGAVRDALLHCSRNYLDLDFVLPNRAVETARKIANHYHAGFVVLDEQRRIARVVFKKGTVDFAQQEGDILEQDLRRRDFTINAIAYNIHKQKLIDPLQGLEDLKKGQLTMVSPDNLKDDPLRLLRAYRQGIQLDFTIEEKTRRTIRQLAPLIGTVAAERVQTELGYLFSNIRGSEGLIEMGKDGLLSPWFQQLTEAKLHTLVIIDKFVQLLKEKLGVGYFDQLFNYDSSSSQYYSLTIQMAKLASLVSSIPEEAELELVNLKYSRSDIRAVTKALTYLPLLLENQGKMSLRNLYFFFLEVGDVFPIIAILALVKGSELRDILLLIDHYLDPKDQVAHPSPLITGHDLIKDLKMKPSPEIGKILTEIQIARIEQKISTKKEALDLAKTYLNDY